MTLPHIALSWNNALDALDIVLTAYVVYLVLLLIRGTRAMNILQGIALLALLRVGAQYFHLWTMFSILNGLLIALSVAIPVVFQPELRRALAQLGRAGFLGRRATHHSAVSLDWLCSQVSQAAAVLSRSRVGAILVIERNAGLAEFVESGTRVDAALSAELLLAIFSPRSPLHDGAAIVHGDRVVAAGCFLPLSEGTFLDRRLGTRHRAAIGITEQTDAVAVVVSEETGDIVIASDGELSGRIDSAPAVANALKTLLLGNVAPRGAEIGTALRALLNRSQPHARSDKTKLHS